MSKENARGMLDDLISRNDVLDKAYAYGTGLEPEGFCVDVEDIQALPSKQPEPQWIPCSERLPEEYGNYLITTYDGNVDIGTIDPNGKSVWSACDANGFYWIRNVIAWKPLPEPWKGAER